MCGINWFLFQLHKIIGFAPGLLQIVMMSEVDMPVRQAGVVYLKNLITNQWVEKEVDPGTPLAFSLHEQDKAMIRDAIVDAVVMAPEVIRVQLAVCVSNIVKHDFPGKWTQIVDKVSIYLQNPDATPWFGALLCLYQLVKNYEIREVTLELLRIIQETENDDLTNVMQKIVCTYSEQLTPIAVEICQHLYIINSSSFPFQIREVTLELLRIIQETENDDLTNVMQKIVCTYSEQLTPIAVEICQHLANTFLSVLDSDEAEACWTLYNFSEIKFQDESILVEAIRLLLNALLHDKELPVKVEAAIAIQMFLNHQKSVVQLIEPQDTGEDPECHAAKLLEVILLQCPGQVDYCIQPFIELMLERLMREIKTSELRTMCLQVVIAALYYNPQLFFQVMNNLQSKLNAQESVTAHFIKQWILDTDCFLGLHDRKLCVLGLCTLLSLPPPRPPVLSECGDKILPSLILLFDGLKRAYEAKAKEDDSSSDSDDSEDIASGEFIFQKDGLDYFTDMMPALHNYITVDTPAFLSSQDYVLAIFNMCRSVLTSQACTTENQSSPTAKSQPKRNKQIILMNRSVLNGSLILALTIVPTLALKQEIEKLQLEKSSLHSKIEKLSNANSIIKKENEILKTNMSSLFKTAQNELERKSRMIDQLRLNSTLKSLFDIVLLADQRKAAAESKRIEQSGGYTFVPTQEVPTSFNFGGQPLGR
ncbi:importin-7-like [Diaphorina citri]|uniref:Importin-7-like n=1 Tax=Diaphorina citri TaxID=121845 RepID=A0A3Q0J867_DIACI|nr:importin-7-like [Diaphorina citri]